MPTLDRSLACLCYAWLAGAIWHVAGPVFAQETRIRFEDVTDISQIEFVHCDGSSGGHYLVEAVASGMASFDYDLDGLVDLYFLNGANLRGSHYDPPPANALYRNLGEFRFSNVSAAARAADTGFGMGVAVGDIDNDGFPDMYVNNFGRNRLYLNNGDGTFSACDDEVLACGEETGGGVVMFDMDADGDLDIYVANYIKFSYDIPPGKQLGRVVYGGPLLYPKASDNLLRNNGDGTFTDVTQEAEIGKAAEWGMGAIAFDYDDDGDTDVFVANDSTRNLLWENDGHGHFADVALLAGLAVDRNGTPEGSMGVDVADVNGDGLLDLFQTTYTKQYVTLYENLGGGFFQDTTARWGLSKGTFYPVNWGAAFADFDNDGDVDLFFANGHIHDNLDDVDDTVSYRIPNMLFENIDGKRMVNVSAGAGPGLQVTESSRGLIVEDLNLDGLLDVVILNSRSRPTVLANRTRTEYGWLMVELIGRTTNRSAAGSRIAVVSGQKTQVREVHCGRGYQGHFGSRLHFGLGNAQQADAVNVRWHADGQIRIGPVPRNTVQTIIQPLPSPPDTR